MKITDVRAHLLSTPIPAEMRVESGAGLKLNRQMCLVEIVTDEGVTGVGSPSGPYDLGVLGRIIDTVIAPHLVGADPRNITHLWHLLYHGEVSRNLGHRGVGIAALSGVDIALWDLKGRLCGYPLYELLGGLYHCDGVRAYASSIYWDLEPHQAAERARELVDEGFPAVKLKVGRTPRRDERNIAAIRAAVGDEVEILVDANQSLDRVAARRLLSALDSHGCYWLEEPLSIDDVEGHALLRDLGTSVRIATGENMYTRHAFADFVRGGSVDVLQADASRAGGISEARRIAELASCHHLDWNPHTFNDLLTVAANLHLVAASPHTAMFEWDVTFNALMSDLGDFTLRLVGGKVHPPSAPGLGIEIDWEFVRAHQWDGEPAIGAGYGMRS